MNYEGKRFKDADAFDYYTISGTVPGAAFQKPAWAILDEEDGGYIAFCTDEGSAVMIADALNHVNEKPCIRVKSHGATYDQTFPDFARLEIQDDELAAEVAFRMLEQPNTPYKWNEDEPEFYMTFEIIDCDGLERALRFALTQSQ